MLLSVCICTCMYVCMYVCVCVCTFFFFKFHQIAQKISSCNNKKEKVSMFIIFAWREAFPLTKFGSVHLHLNVYNKEILLLLLSAVANVEAGPLIDYIYPFS